MSTEKNNDILRKKQQINAKENEIKENLDSLSYKDVKESKKDANIIGDSDHE